MKKFFIGLLAALSGLYLLNPGAGIFEFLPDNIPFLGNVDEGLALYLFLSSIEYFRTGDFGIFKDRIKDHNSKSSKK